MSGEQRPAGARAASGAGPLSISPRGGEAGRPRGDSRIAPTGEERRPRPHPWAITRVAPTGGHGSAGCRWPLAAGGGPSSQSSPVGRRGRPPHATPPARPLGARPLSISPRWGEAGRDGRFANRPYRGGEKAPPARLSDHKGRPYGWGMEVPAIDGRWRPAGAPHLNLLPWGEEEDLPAPPLRRARWARALSQISPRGGRDGRFANRPYRGGEKAPPAALGDHKGRPYGWGMEVPAIDGRWWPAGGPLISIFSRGEKRKSSPRHPSGAPVGRAPSLKSPPDGERPEGTGDSRIAPTGEERRPRPHPWAITRVAPMGGAWKCRLSMAVGGRRGGPSSQSSPVGRRGRPPRATPPARPMGARPLSNLPQRGRGKTTPFHPFSNQRRGFCKGLQRERG